MVFCWFTYWRAHLPLLSTVSFTQFESPGSPATPVRRTSLYSLFASGEQNGTATIQAGLTDTVARLRKQRDSQMQRDPSRDQDIAGSPDLGGLIQICKRQARPQPGIRLGSRIGADYSCCWASSCRARSPHTPFIQCCLSSFALSISASAASEPTAASQGQAISFNLRVRACQSPGIPYEPLHS